ncbi:MAG: motility protein A [Acidimicrobiales bacterium]
MDPATIIGILVAIGAVFGAGFMAGLNPIAIFLADIPSIILVLGGAIGVTIANNTMPATIGGLKAAVKGLTGGLGTDPTDIVTKLVEFADLARKEGLLALESRLDEIDDPFFRRGMELAVDGTDPEVVREMLEIEVENMQARHKIGAGFWATAAGMGPAMGMIGTVIGLVDMLGNLDDPSALGPSMAVAFLTTLWGAFLANVIFTPISGKLKALSAAEVKSRELIIEGILSVQAGSNPRAVAGKLAAFLPPSAREAVLESKSA